MSTQTEAQARLTRLEGYLDQDPENAGLRAAAATAAIEAGALEQAGQLLGTPAASADTQLQYVRGLLQLARHQFADAAGTFERLLVVWGDAAALRFNLGYALFRHGEHLRAAAVFQDLITHADASTESLSYLLRSLHHAGDPLRALAAWRVAPPGLKTPQAVGVASLVCLDCNQQAEALSLSVQALREDPPPLEALVVRATLAVGEGNTQLAIELLDQAVLRSPRDGRIWSAIAAAWMLQGNVRAASEAFERSAELLPAHVGSWVSLSWCQILLRDLDGARSSLETALEIDRNFAETHGGLGVVAAMQGRRIEAELAIERALRLDRTSMSARYAEAVLQGRATDAPAIQALARKLLRGRTSLGATSLLERALQGLQPLGPHDIHVR